MYQILCLTSGDFIKLDKTLAGLEVHLPGIPQHIKNAISPLYDLTYGFRHKPSMNQRETITWDYAKFETEEAANWFISHRLVYNPRRNNPKKLYVMKMLFEYNNVPGWQTCKIEFEIQKV